MNPLQNAPKVISEIVTSLDNHRSHKLDKGNIHKIVNHGLWLLTLDGAECEYISKERVALPCSLLVDRSQRRVSIILEEWGYSPRQPRTRCSDVIEICLQNQKPTLSEAICYIDTEKASIVHEKKYGEVMSVAGASDGLRYTAPKYNPVPLKPLFFDIIREVGMLICQMHSDGFVHGNIIPRVIRQAPNRGYVLTDFTLTTAISEKKREADWYNFGCTLYKIFLLKDPPWKKENTPNRRRKKLEEALKEFADKKAKCADRGSRAFYSVFESLFGPEKMTNTTCNNLVASFASIEESSIQIEDCTVHLKRDCTPPKI
ncbi:MAG: hypothetical protein JSR37_09050 [Verrucomicrobia bacterium]|nr:hypothetical protein [Verrucomicrobiota bacterium]MBS0637750.1 hypothetical protein [Verrucomicrobiota bacterium]